ncbi:AMP-dependent synthetase [Cryobacterium algoritolerans]|uniref:AMP-dependent synthetase n=1 Tax=Cryobacterium algoritolerans TaxID=1259184 RepID=A0A4R8WU15_9MICO|nr:AMP-binding protein [Cryobacterium algoritolerans]TFC15197.1 AMP-dependent synthetase [Cryobacterium algoritolerans]
MQPVMSAQCTPTVGFEALRLLAGEPSATALVTADGTLTYAELDERVRDRRDKLGDGRRLVMVSCANALEPLVTYLAALSAGHPVLLVAGDADEPNQERNRIGLLERYNPDVVLAPVGNEWRLDERREGSRHTLHPELALLLSTSGSTGSPKLVRLSRENVRSNARSIADYLDLTPQDRAATTLPMHYCYGLSVVNSHLISGASLLLTERSVVESDFWNEFEAAGATSFAGVPYTFDLLDSIGFARREHTSLRYITQAGGRLGPDRVRSYARLGKERGFDFVVMYGQTEATARMAYLPPELTEERPESIGIPIPGGQFRIDDAGEDSVGELVYTGPNVMMGYAESPAELAAGPTVGDLRTGDLARQHDDGLFEIVGRSSRFVKIYGLRIDLDRVERLLADDGVEARAVNLEERLVVFVRQRWALGFVVPIAAEALGLPCHSVRAHLIEEFPLTSSGKPDTASLLREAALLERNVPLEDRSGAVTAENIRALYSTLLDRPDAVADDSFVALHGDSLSYVEVSVRLEQMLGTLPRDWPAKSAQELASHRTAPAGARPRRRLARMETSVVLRAIAIVLITGTHTNLLHVQGGAHLLLGILGFNLARFQFADVPRPMRLGKLLRSAVQIFVPAVLWIGGVALIGGMYEPATVFMLHNLLGGDERWTMQWQYWFLESVVWTILGLALVFCVPQLDRLERRYPFVFAACFVAGALVLRLLLTGGVEAGPTERYSLPIVLWLIALGWLIARSTEVKRRVLSSAVVVLTVSGFFGDPAREAITIAGLLLLLWIPAAPLPRILVPVLGVVASASLCTSSSGRSTRFSRTNSLYSPPSPPSRWGSSPGKDIPH